MCRTPKTDQLRTKDGGFRHRATENHDMPSCHPHRATQPAPLSGSWFLIFFCEDSLGNLGSCRAPIDMVAARITSKASQVRIRSLLSQPLPSREPLSSRLWGPIEVQHILRLDISREGDHFNNILNLINRIISSQTQKKACQPNGHSSEQPHIAPCQACVPCIQLTSVVRHTTVSCDYLGISYYACLGALGASRLRASLETALAAWGPSLAGDMPTYSGLYYVWHSRHGVRIWRQQCHPNTV